MKKIITTIALFVVAISFAQGQFEQGMGKAFQLWGEGKNTEASAMFERIAAAEKTSWLPNYYVALVNTTASFGTHHHSFWDKRQRTNRFVADKSTKCFRCRIDKNS